MSVISFKKEAKGVVTPPNKNTTKNGICFSIMDWWKKNKNSDINIIWTKAKRPVAAAGPDEDDDGEEIDDTQSGTSSDSQEKTCFCSQQRLVSQTSQGGIPLHGEAGVHLCRYSCSSTNHRGRLSPACRGRRLSSQTSFNIDEMRLLWKMLPSGTFLFKNEEVGLKGTQKPHDAHHMRECGGLYNEARSYKSKNPRSLKSKKNTLLPFFFWMTSWRWRSQQVEKRKTKKRKFIFSLSTWQHAYLYSR